MLDDNTPTSTSNQQTALEKKLLPLYQELDAMEPEDVTETLRLLRTVHAAYLQAGLGKLPAGFASLGASRPWIVYWITHSLALLGADLPPAGPNANEVVEFLRLCQSPQGGFGGGPLQLPHLAPSYAAVCTALTLGGQSALLAVDREAMDSFLRSLIIPPEQGGGLAIHPGGETDLRSCYLAIAIAHMLCLDTADLAAQSGVVDYIRRCQTYEGGLGGEPGNEAHGGYTYCGLAALCLLGQQSTLDLPALVNWATQRQCSMEGGFNGRTNKLVDGCYSFWQGSLFTIMQRLPQPSLFSPGQASRAPAPGAAPPPAPAPQLPVIPVPALPFLVPKSPVEQATAILTQKQALAQQVISVALQAGDRADAALHGNTERSSAAAATDARALLNQAGAAQAAAESAHFNVSSSGCSACMLYPLPDSSDPPLPAVHVMGSKSVHLGPPLYNYKALQLWVLRCCQQLRGGLKDKPGKPADYYHTCYCLSGLSTAQHASNAVVGPRENLLKRADPLVNVLDERVEAARRFYATRPLSVTGRLSGGSAAMQQGSGGSGGSVGSWGRLSGGSKMDVDL